MTARPPEQIDVEEYIAALHPDQPRRVASTGPAVDPYAPLMAVLVDAYNQAANGKGKVRHANGQSFLKQPIMEIGRVVGLGYQIGQAMKKSQEAMGMVERGERPAAQAELLGAINYLAAAYLLIGEGNLASKV